MNSKNKIYTKNQLVGIVNAVLLGAQRLLVITLLIILFNYIGTIT